MLGVVDGAFDSRHVLFESYGSQGSDLIRVYQFACCVLCPGSRFEGITGLGSFNTDEAESSKCFEVETKRLVVRLESQ